MYSERVPALRRGDLYNFILSGEAGEVVWGGVGDVSRVFAGWEVGLLSGAWEAGLCTAKALTLHVKALISMPATTAFLKVSTITFQRNF